MQSDEEYRQEMAIWEDVYERLCDVLEQFGEEGVSDDYWVHDFYWGYPQVKYLAMDMKMLAPPVVAAVQEMLTEFPAIWEIIVAIDTPQTGNNRPEMGLRIRAREIVDELQRQYLPPEYRDLSYPTARPWTPSDDWMSTLDR